MKFKVDEWVYYCSLPDVKLLSDERRPAVILNILKEDPIYDYEIYIDVSNNYDKRENMTLYEYLKAHSIIEIFKNNCFYTIGIGVYGPLSSDEDNFVTPKEFALLGNYPNPFNPVTTLRFDLDYTSKVNVTVYNILGNEIITLQNGELVAGRHSIQWNANNNQGQPVSAGVYIYTIEAGKFRQTKKMILLK